MLERKNKKKERKAGQEKRVGTLRKARENAKRAARPLLAVGAAHEVVQEKDK